MIAFPKNAYAYLEPLFKKVGANLEEDKDFLQKYNLYGFDIYQAVNYFRLDCQRAKSFKTFNLETFKKQKPLWRRAQEAFNKKHPELDAVTVEQLNLAFKETEDYLAHFNDETKTIGVSRSSGVAHKIQISPNTNMFRASYRPIAFLFSDNNSLPRWDINAEKKGHNPRRRLRNDSITMQYKSKPQDFEFYKKIGIFEIYNKHCLI